MVIDDDSAGLGLHHPNLHHLHHSPTNLNLDPLPAYTYLHLRNQISPK